MIDIQLLRNDIDAVAKRLATRGYELDVEKFRTLESTRKSIQSEVQQLQTRRNDVAKQVGKAKRDGGDSSALMAEGKELNESLHVGETQLERLQEVLSTFIQDIPNIPHQSTPVGSKPEDAIEQRRWGEARKFEFASKDHVDIGAGLDGMDFDAGAKLAGARFVVMKAASRACIARSPSSCSIRTPPNTAIPRCTRLTW